MPLVEDNSENPVAPLKTAAGPSERRRARRRRWILGALLVLLVAGEIGMRTLANKDSRWNIRLGDSQEWDAHRKHRWKRNYQGGGMSTNSRGFVNPEFDSRKRPGSTRIVCLGDSSAVIPPSRNYPMALQDRLRAKLANRQIDVINAGCSGYDSGQARTWYEEDIDGIEHDILVIYLGWNDMGKYNPDGLIDKLNQAGYAEHPSFAQQCMLNIYLLRGLYAVREHFLARGDVSREPLTPEDAARYEAFQPEHYEKNLTAIIELARSRGRVVRLANFAGLVRADPTEDEMRRMHFPTGMGKNLSKYLVLKGKYERALERVSTATQTPIIDIASKFGTPEDRVVFSDSAHFNEKGADMVAEVMTQALIPVIESPQE